MKIQFTLTAMLCLSFLSGCQYVSYYKTNTTRAPAELQESPEVVCSALGARRGDATFDRCVAEEEDRHYRKRQRDAGY
jgi:hypothetical protein